MKSVIILGMGPTRTECPYDEEVWGVNNCYEFAPRMDRLFIMDSINDIEFDLNELRKLPRIIASTTYPELGLENVEAYPVGEVVSRFKTRYFCNSVCYMVALAIHEGYERIRMYGVDCDTQGSYVLERCGLEWWLGVAHALGVEVINTLESSTGRTFDGRMYGHWPSGSAWGELVDERPESLTERIRSFVSQIPGVLDESMIYVPDGEGGWQRKGQRVVQMSREYWEMFGREMEGAMVKGARVERTSVKGMLEGAGKR